MTNKNGEELVTKTMLGEAVDAILEGMQAMFDQSRSELQIVKEDLNELRDEVKTGFAHVKDEIKGLREEFSTMPNRQEFNHLESRVTTLEQKH